VRNTGRNACTTLAINFIIHLPKTLFFDYIYKKSGMHPPCVKIEINYDFNILATLKDKQLQVGKRLLQVNIIHTDIFNQ